ncbi:uncharacterized protein LOC110940126 isoform X4 [Helianthus annuus]|uniref:uncharacterized protein LOC110940126 isoform X4 n=1 Tax=Helianthus annuus TaxID=4232 RepID=UPI001652F45D|nr:uncharacterized protein LOC110940126 isoform X4 [Helianthus annuus]
MILWKIYIAGGRCMWPEDGKKDQNTFWLVYAICDSGGCALEVVVNGGCPSVQLLAINLSPVNFTYKTPLIQESGVVNMYVEFEEAILNPDVSCDAVEVLVSFFYSNR